MGVFSKSSVEILRTTHELASEDDLVSEMIYTLTRIIKHDYIAKNWKYKLSPLGQNWRRVHIFFDYSRAEPVMTISLK